MTKKKDLRYEAVKLLIESGEIKTFRQIFDFIPKTVVSKDMGMNHETFEKILKDPFSLEGSKKVQLAELIGCKPIQIVSLVNATTPFGKRRTNKKRKK